LKIDARSAFEIGDKYDSHVPILKLFYAFGPCRCTTRYLAVLDVHIVQHRHYPRITADILTGDYEFRIGPILYDLFDALQFCRRPPSSRVIADMYQIFYRQFNSTVGTRAVSHHPREDASPAEYFATLLFQYRFAQIVKADRTVLLERLGPSRPQF
jgi:hypothetical protein